MHQGINLAQIGGRLLPAYFNQGESVLFDILDGSAEQQIDAFIIISVKVPCGYLLRLQSSEFIRSKSDYQLIFNFQSVKKCLISVDITLGSHNLCLTS